MQTINVNLGVSTDEKRAYRLLQHALRWRKEAIVYAKLFACRDLSEDLKV